MNLRLRACVLNAALLLGGTATADSFELSGFSKVISTYVDGDFEGADYDVPVQLENGMVFQFNTYHYTYAYRPRADVFRKTFSVAELKALKVKNPTGPVTLYKLLIRDYIYSVFRIR